MSRNFDPEETRRVGKEVVPKLAEDYATIALVAERAGKERDGGISPEMAETFDAYYKLLNSALAETAFNLDKLGPSLVAMAEDDELTEAEIEKEMTGAAEELQSAVYEPSGYEVMTDEDDPADLEETPASFDEELGGGYNETRGGEQEA